MVPNEVLFNGLQMLLYVLINISFQNLFFHRNCRNIRSLHTYGVRWMYLPWVIKNPIRNKSYRIKSFLHGFLLLFEIWNKRSNSIVSSSTSIFSKSTVQQIPQSSKINTTILKFDQWPRVNLIAMPLLATKKKCQLKWVTKIHI